MKPPPFRYEVATSLEHAMDLVAGDEDAKFIAGGQSLLPLLSLRFASPSLLVDIGRIPGLNCVEEDDGSVRIGALTPHSEIERNADIKRAVPVLSAAAGWVAHPQVRNRGTFGGAIAHSDAAAEFPAVLLAADAVVVTASKAGQRKIAAADFFGPHFQTALEHGELIVAVEVPSFTAQTRWGFHEFARRKGDYAIGGAAVVATVDAQNKCTGVRAGLIAAGSGPTLAPGLTDLIGQSVTLENISAAAENAGSLLTPESNIHGSSGYRRAVIAEALRRALGEAFQLLDVQGERNSA